MAAYAPNAENGYPVSETEKPVVEQVGDLLRWRQKGEKLGMGAAEQGQGLVTVNAFAALTKEKREFNQYWYSAHTVKVMAKEIEESATKAAFLSTPSVYFSLQDPQLKKCSFFFDLDTQWARLPNFIRYDYNQPHDIDESLHHAFDCVVIDPPFITSDVWAKYAETARLLLINGELGAFRDHFCYVGRLVNRSKSKIILSTIAENAEMLKQMLEVEPQVFMPSIPHLVYQYLFYTNFRTKYLSSPNPELQ